MIYWFKFNVYYVIMHRQPYIDDIVYLCCISTFFGVWCLFNPFEMVSVAEKLIGFLTDIIGWNMVLNCSFVVSEQCWSWINVTMRIQLILHGFAKLHLLMSMENFDFKSVPQHEHSSFYTQLFTILAISPLPKSVSNAGSKSFKFQINIICNSTYKTSH